MRSRDTFNTGAMAEGHRTRPTIYVHALCVTFISVEANTNSLNLTLVHAEVKAFAEALLLY